MKWKRGIIMNSLTKVGKFLNFNAQERITDARRIKIWVRFAAQTVRITIFFRWELLFLVFLEQAVRIASMMSKTHITKLLPTYHNSGVWTIVRIFFSHGYCFWDGPSERDRRNGEVYILEFFPFHLFWFNGWVNVRVCEFQIKKR